MSSEDYGTTLRPCSARRFAFCACPLLALSDVSLAFDGMSAIGATTDIGQTWARMCPLKMTRSGHCAPKANCQTIGFGSTLQREITMEDRHMIRIISVAFVLALASSSTQAMPLAAIQQPDSMVTKVVAGCGVGMTRVNGVCVSRHHKRQARRCARWNGSTCAAWKYY